MMTRKDYVEVARILNKYKTTIEEKDFVDLTDDFSYMFEKDNPRFNLEKFLEACNVQSIHNNSSTIFSGQRFYFASHDVPNAKRRLARNKKRFAKVNRDPEQD